MRIVPVWTLVTWLALAAPPTALAAETPSPASAQVGIGSAMMAAGSISMLAGGACVDGLIGGDCAAAFAVVPALWAPGLATLVAGMVQAEEADAWGGDPAQLALRHHLLSARILSPFYLLAGGILGGAGLSLGISLAAEGQFPPGEPGLAVAALPLSGFTMLTAGLVMTFEGEAALRQSRGLVDTDPGTYLMQGAGFLAIAGAALAASHGFVHGIMDIFGGYWVDPFAAAYLLAAAYEITAISMLVAGARRSEGYRPATPDWGPGPEPEPPLLIHAISPFHDARTGTTGLTISGRFR